MSLLIFYLLLALVVSFFCSIAEAVLLSVRPSYIAALKKDKSSTKTLQKLTKNLDRPLAAILTANTIAHTVGAAGVGAQSAVVFGNEYLGITSAILTILVLLFSEIIPKTLGAVYWKQLAPTFGTLIDWLTISLYPIVWMSEKLTRVLSQSSLHGSTFSRSEVTAMVEIGKEEGVLDESEHSIVSNLMALKNISVRKVMTPRTVMFSVSSGLSVKDFFKDHSETVFSRIPIIDKKSNAITSYVLKTDLLLAQAKDDFDTKIEEFKRDLPVIDQSLSVSQAYKKLMSEKSHIALIVDEYGTTQGLITQEDVIETLLGLEITDELDTIEDMQSIANQRWRERMKAIGVNPDKLS